MKQFDYYKLRKPKMAKHDLSHTTTLTMNMGDLVPVYMDEVLPGDVFRINTEMLLKMQPLISPIMHRVNVYMHFFYVPQRLINTSWEDFLIGGVDGKTVVNIAKITGTNKQFRSAVTVGSLADYLGLPTNQYPDNYNAAEGISQAPFRAYQKVYNEWYMDKNLNSPSFENWGNVDYAITSPAAIALMKLQKRCWEKDYFTSSLPFAQRGDAVTIPISGSAPLRGQIGLIDNEGDPFSVGGVKTDANGMLQVQELSTGENAYIGGEFNESYADLSAASSASINDLRRTFAVQRFLEKMARGGSRFYEYLLNIFGVRTSDSRLQRSEYLGGGRLPVKIGEVLQTSETTDASPQANMAGRGISGGDIVGFSRRFEEHGIVLGILSVMPRTCYFQGLPKIFSKFDRFDYFTPDFAHIGEQPVYRRELYLAESTENAQTFGYQPRYSEYRYKFDTVKGQMRDTMLFWSLARKFDSNPLLNNSFVESNPSTRIFSVENVGTYGELIVQLFFDIRAYRPVPKFGEPI